MIGEVPIAGVLLAPIAVYDVLSALLFLGCRMVLGHSGLLARVWHPALFEVALFLCLLYLLVRFF